MRRWMMASFLALALVACGGEENNEHEHNNHDHTGHNNTAAEVDTYSDGMMKMTADGHFHVMLMSANPGPPDVGENTWTIKVMDMDDNPINEAKVTVTPFMPAHGHGTNPADYSGSFTSDGTYEAGPFDLFMPGVWETTVTVEGEMTDSVKFSFSLEG